MRVWYTPDTGLSTGIPQIMLTTMSKPKRTRTDAQIAAEAAYAATHEVIQVNVKFKSKEDLKMFKKLRERFPDDKDPAIIRKAVKLLASKSNRG